MHNMTEKDAEKLAYHQEKSRQLYILGTNHTENCIQCMTGYRCAWAKDNQQEQIHHKASANRIGRLVGIQVEGWTDLTVSKYHAALARTEGGK